MNNQHLKGIMTKLIAGAGFFIASFTSFAHSVTPQPHERTDYSWSIVASIGYTNFQSMYAREGQTPVLRLAFDKGLFAIKNLGVGVELGVQNGNSMRLNVSQEDLDILGGAPVQTTVNPIIDLLATVITQPLFNTPLFAQVKGGIAYRSWQFEDRTSINPMSNVAGELQAGFGLSLNKMTNLSILYQGIYGGSPNFVVNATNETGQLNSIPIQNGILLSLDVTV